MIDFIKITSLPISIDGLVNNPYLNFPLSSVNESGEINGKNQSCTYKGLIFTINRINDTKKLKGSLHAYSNGGDHNHNDFTFCELIKTIIDIQQKIHIDPDKCTLRNLEYGVNLEISFSPNDVFKDIIHHSRVPFMRMTEGKGIYCEHSQYKIKIYDKGFQFQLPYQELRIEIRVNTMDYLHSKKIPIYTLADLMSLDNLKLLGEDLQRVFNEITFYDSTIITNKLSMDDQLFLSNARNPLFWQEQTKNQNDVARRKYNKLYLKYVNRNWKQIITPMINEKLCELLVEPNNKTINIIEKLNTSHKLSLSETIVNISSSDKSPEVEDHSNDLCEISDSDTVLISDNAINEITKISDSVFSQTSTQLPTEQFDERTIDRWDVNGLEDFFNSQKLPEIIQLDRCTRIVDPQLFIQSHLRAIKAHNGHEIFFPQYQRLIQARDFLEKGLMKNVIPEKDIEP